MAKKPIELLDYQRIAELSGLSAATLRVWQKRGKMPDPDYRLGQSPGWLPATILPWIEAVKVTENEG